MEQLLSLLKTIPEYAAMVSSLQDGESVAVTGIGQINRSHMIAGLCRSINRPMVVLCQDDLAARRLQEELKGFLADTAPILPGRDLTLYDAAVVSRSWEQKRLRQLYDLATGKTGLQIMTWESLSLRTMPKAALLSAAFSVRRMRFSLPSFSSGSRIMRSLCSIDCSSRVAVLLRMLNSASISF